MSVNVSFSLKDLHKLHLLSNPIEETYGGGIYRARTRGKSIVAFAEVQSELTQRLYTLEVMKTKVCIKQCDREADRKELLAERFAAKAVRRFRNGNQSDNEKRSASEVV